MLIYTGQFSQHEIYEKAGLVVVSIARYDPKWFNGNSIKALAPSETLLDEYKAGLSFGLFAKRFLEYLETVDMPVVIRVIEEFGKGYSGVVLCCYEPKTSFCHRHLVANFLNSNYGLGIKEY